MESGFHAALGHRQQEMCKRWLFSNRLTARHTLRPGTAHCLIGEKPRKNNRPIVPKCAAFYLALLFALIFGTDLELRTCPCPESKP